ncbi:hypothetical protein PLICRDRAFT_51294 [Plicaturopsis crispa FD-325 SS-3]|nr:hypothetical protein PLICRDRAFT_51294 [Plicaturopsis crispa FD-325 SS-3]
MQGPVSPGAEGGHNGMTTVPGRDEGRDGEGTGRQGPIVYSDAQHLFTALQSCFKAQNVFFHGRFVMPVDPLVTEKEHVQMMAHEVWKVTGYRFRYGHKTRMWCCQDKGRKQQARPSQRPEAKHRDNLGMKRYNCRSRLHISCRKEKDMDSCIITLHIEHHTTHNPYYDVTMPAEASQMIREGLEWSTPNSLKHDQIQLPSARILLGEFLDKVDLFEPDVVEGIEQLCWGMKKIAGPLSGKIVEVRLKATYGTNAKHLRLYTVLGEYDNAGFPLSYCLLSTASSIEIRKRATELKNWAQCLRSAYKVVPPLAKNKLSTTPYDAERAMKEFCFIDSMFVPPGCSDTDEYEGGNLENYSIPEPLPGMEGECGSGNA